MKMAHLFGVHKEHLKGKLKEQNQSLCKMKHTPHHSSGG
jgi:hypothetical protein